MPKMPSEAEVEQAYVAKFNEMATNGTRGVQMEAIAHRIIEHVVEESLSAWPLFCELWPEIQKSLGEIHPALRPPISHDGNKESSRRD